MASGNLFSDRPVIGVVHNRIRHYKAKSIADGKASQKQKQKKSPLSKPIIETLMEELEELKSNLISALAEKLNQTMASSVLRILIRRIRKYEKKCDHIIRVEELLASGKTLQEEQDEVLRSKPVVTALMKELRELTWPLISALTEELRQICQSSFFMFDAFTHTYNPIEELLRLVNLASLLDARSQSECPSLTTLHTYSNRYDHRQPDKEVPSLSQNDQKFISLLRSLVTSSSQPVNEIGSHTSALVDANCLYLILESTSKRGEMDSDSHSEVQSNKQETPWAKLPSLSNTKLILRDSLGRANKDTGTFFWIPVSDIQRHSEKACLDGRLGGMWEGITRFRFNNKSWKIMHCYSCNESFLDRESHTVHMEHKHQLSLSDGKSWLVPGMENFIPLDCTDSYFLVDTTKFYHQKVNDSEELCLRKQKQFMVVLKGLQDQVSDIKHLLTTKSKHLRSLEAVQCLHDMLFNGNYSLALLVTWLHKLSFSKPRVGTCHLFQLFFLCRVLEQAQAPLSNDTVKHAFAKMQRHLITKLHELDCKIKELIFQKKSSWQRLSDLSVCDYRSEIFPCVRSFIQETFGIYGNHFSSACDKLKNVLSSICSDDFLRSAYSFNVEVFPGKVLIHKMNRKPTWSYGYIGFLLKFDGEWFVKDYRERISGSYRFSGSCHWHEHGLLVASDLSLHVKPKASERLRFFRMMLHGLFNFIVMEKLRLFQEDFEQEVVGH